MNPEDLLFAKTHEWVALEEADGARIATIGISAFAVESLTDLVFIELESVKAVSDVYSPVAGEVIEVNTPLADALEKLSDDPYGEGWIAKVRVEDDSGLTDLMDYADYQKVCAEEAL